MIIPLFLLNVIDPRKQHLTEGFPLATDTTRFLTAF